jgi:hypothetical protein
LLVQRTHVVVTAVVIALIGAVLPASSGCRGSARSSPAPQASTTPVPPKPPQPEAPAQAQPTRPPAVAPVDFERLVALVPELPGWTRTTPRGQQSTAGIAVSEATAAYARGESTIKLEITDSAFNDLVLAPLSTMLGPTYSERTATSYRKYAAVGGWPGFESWLSDANEGDVTVVAGKRFVVSARGFGVTSLDPVRALVQAVDLTRLAALK